MGVQARCLVNLGCSLGEGPIWDSGSQRLYWVDILESRIYRYDPADERTSSWATPEHVGFVFVRADGGLIAGFQVGAPSCGARGRRERDGVANRPRRRTPWNVTKAAFGGEHGDLLYVTSARIESDEETLARYPDTGGVIEV